MPKLLVIDDEVKTRSVIRQHLVKANYQVIEADSGETAIQKLKEEGYPSMFDAAICNIRMPVDGTDAIHYLHKEYPTLPLIGITTLADALLVEDLLKSEIEAYFFKPIGKESLLVAVNKAVPRGMTQ